MSVCNIYQDRQQKVMDQRDSRKCHTDTLRHTRNSLVQEKKVHKFLELAEHVALLHATGLILKAEAESLAYYARSKSEHTLHGA
jgi:hypothetical protein